MAAKKLTTKNPEAVNDVEIDDNSYKFVCESPEYTIFIPVIGEGGKQEVNRGPLREITSLKYKPIKFTTINTNKKDNDGYPFSYSILITSKAIHGDDFELIMERIETLLKRPSSRVMTSDDFKKKHNAEAYRHEKAALDLANENADLKKQIEALQAKTGVNLGSNDSKK